MATTVVWQKWNTLQTKPITNYEMLIRKTPEELASFMNHGACPPGEDVSELCYDEDGGSVPDICNLCWLKWLKEEAKG